MSSVWISEQTANFTCTDSIILRHPKHDCCFYESSACVRVRTCVCVRARACVRVSNNKDTVVFEMSHNLSTTRSCLQKNGMGCVCAVRTGASGI